MITFKNNCESPLEIDISGKKILIEEYNDYIYQASENELEFIVYSHNSKISFFNKILGFFMLSIVGLIGLLLDMADDIYSKFENYLDLPVKARLSNINTDIIVTLNEGRLKGYCVSINANTSIDTEVIIDNSIIDKQYKSYIFESIAVFAIPIALCAILAVIGIIKKAYFVTLIAIGIFIIFWYPVHSKNKKYIKKTKDKA